MEEHDNSSILHFMQNIDTKVRFGVHNTSYLYIFWCISIVVMYLLLGQFFIKLHRTEPGITQNLFRAYLYLLLITEWFFLYFMLNLRAPKFRPTRLPPTRYFLCITRDYLLDIKSFSFFLPLPFFVYVASGSRISEIVIIVFIILLYYFELQLIALITLISFKLSHRNLEHLKHLMGPVLITLFSLGILSKSYYYYDIIPILFVAEKSIAFRITGDFMNSGLLIVVLGLIGVFLAILGRQITAKYQKRLNEQMAP